jgi:DNA sulfur modification protein DndD
LSAGEKQVLALSFMAALSDISGFTAPIVIDTPLGRISSEPKELIAQNLPAYLEDTQITFLMTDEEYTSTVQGLIQDRVANEYKLNYANGTTEVTAYE